MSDIKNYVEIHFGLNSIMVNNDPLGIEGGYSVDSMKNPPENKEKINNIVWDTSYSFNSISKGSVNYNDGSTVIFDESKYNDWIQPYVDIWQAEKDRLEQEEQEEQAEWNKFENRQARALVNFSNDFETVKNRAHIKSSLGFTADANRTANENVSGLIETIGDGTVQFCDYYNQFHELTKSDLETLKAEIIKNAQNLYQQKWVYRAQIEQCESNEGLDAVLETINFTYMDFTQTGTGDGEQAAEQA